MKKISYFKEYFLNDKSKIEQLLEIDENYTFESFYELLNKNINIPVDNYETVLLENSPIILLNILEKDINIIVCTLDNYGINKYIIEKYNEYLKENNIEKEKNIEINNHFNIKDNNIISIGSESFNKEMSNNYNNIKCIDIEI